jgi:hypothetical protein
MLKSGRTASLFRKPPPAGKKSRRRREKRTEESGNAVTRRVEKQHIIYRKENPSFVKRGL